MALNYNRNNNNNNSHPSSNTRRRSRVPIRHVVQTRAQAKAIVGVKVKPKNYKEVSSSNSTEEDYSMTTEDSQ
jgi:hypothetical protein